MPVAKMTSGRAGVVRLSIPAKIANDLGALEDTFRRVAEDLGHGRCFTGCSSFYVDTVRQLRIELDGQIAQIHGPFLAQDAPPSLPSDPVPLQVAIPERLNSDIDAMIETIRLVAGKLGCEDCHSGFNLLYQTQLDMIAIDERMNVQGFGQFA